MKKGYAYLDESGILFVNDDIDVARKYSGVGSVIETDLSHESGTLIIDALVDNDEQTIDGPLILTNAIEYIDRGLDLEIDVYDNEEKKIEISDFLYDAIYDLVMRIIE